MTWSVAHDDGSQVSRRGNFAASLAKRPLAAGVTTTSDSARTPLSITDRVDGGKTWGRHLSLESNPGEYSYPSVLQTADGLIHVTYTYRRYSIKHVEFNENWLDHLNRPN